MLIDHINKLLERTEDQEIRKVLVATTTLFAAVEHGGEDHRDWLETAIEAHFTGGQMPEYKK